MCDSAGWKNLRSLTIDFNPISAANLAKILRNCPKLEDLSINGCGGQHQDLNFMHFDMEDHPEFSRKGLNIEHRRY